MEAEQTQSPLDGGTPRSLVSGRTGAHGSPGSSPGSTWPMKDARYKVGAAVQGGVGETLTVGCSLRAKVWVDLGGRRGETKVAVVRSV